MEGGRAKELEKNGLRTRIRVSSSYLVVYVAGLKLQKASGLKSLERHVIVQIRFQSGSCQFPHDSDTK